MFISAPLSQTPAVFRDLTFASVGVVPAPLAASINDAGDTVTFTYDDGTVISPGALASWQALMFTNPQPASAPWRVAQALLDKVQPALTANGTYLALASPSAAQNTAQIKLLTRQVNALLRLTGSMLDSTVNT